MSISKKLFLLITILFLCFTVSCNISSFFNGQLLFYPNQTGRMLSFGKNYLIYSDVNRSKLFLTKIMILAINDFIINQKIMRITDSSLIFIQKIISLKSEIEIRIVFPNAGKSRFCVLR